MIGIFRPGAVIAYGEPVDMRKSFDGLAALARERLGEDPLSGSYFLFVSRSLRRAKVLVWDGTGLCIYAKLLVKGRFTAPWACRGEARLRLTISELALFLEGMELAGRLPLSPAPYDPGALSVPAR